MPIRIEVDVTTGERREIELTPEEIADAQARTSAEVAVHARAVAFDNAIAGDATLSSLKAMTNAEFDAWWDANVTNATQAIGVLKRLARVLVRRVL